MSGFVTLHRDIFKHDIIGPAASNDRFIVFTFLLFHARWRDGQIAINTDVVDVKRGQVFTAVRYIQKGTGIPVQRVRNSLKILEKANIIQQKSTHRGTMVTICNYSKYQDQQQPDNKQTTNRQQTNNKQTTQIRTKETKETRETREAQAHKYMFEGEVIRLTGKDYNAWENVFNSIPDLVGELQTLDDWIRTEPEAKQKKWFSLISGALRNKNNAYKLNPPPKPTSTRKGYPI